ncbi:MAG: hypothetical protein SR1Q7_07250 [Quinella sp. 1Q7]|nr:hypothetical protein [Quinella sp. 1Q7]
MNILPSVVTANFRENHGGKSLGIDQQHFFGRRVICKQFNGRLAEVSEKTFSYSGKIWSRRAIILHLKSEAISTTKKTLAAKFMHCGSKPVQR